MTWWLITFSRRGPARYLSHLDTQRVVQRTFARAGVPIALSQGMRPKPRLLAPLPLPVGAAGASELAVVEVPEDTAVGTTTLGALREASPPRFAPEEIVDAASATHARRRVRLSTPRGGRRRRRRRRGRRTLQRRKRTRSASA